MLKTLSFTALLLGSLFLKAGINLTLDYATFNIIDEKPYVELYLNINGNSILYANTKDELYQAKIEITYLIEKGDEVVAFEKFQINSPEYKAEDIKLNLIDLKRIPIENGEYQLTLIAKDLVNKESPATEVQQKLKTINFPANEISFSGIQLANQVTAATDINGSFVKNGFDIIPNITHVYKEDQNSLHFYAELYHADQSLGESEAFLIEYAIVDPKNNEIVANLRGVKRLTASSVIPLLYYFNLSELPSGEYNLQLTAKNRNNESIAEKNISFYRINPNLINYSSVNAENTFVDSITNPKELEAYIKSLAPISTHDELIFAQNQLEYGDLKFMQQYFLNFWKTRDQINPEQKWLAYKEKVILVDKEFGYGGVKGYTTERGRVYLQYGPPNAVQDVPYDRDTYPYSIWQYYKLQGLTDRKIVFYSPSMEMLGYEILHSNIRGEVFNPNWELDLVSKSNGNKSTQEVMEGSVINEPANTLFNNPR